MHPYSLMIIQKTFRTEANYPKQGHTNQFEFQRYNCISSEVLMRFPPSNIPHSILASTIFSVADSILWLCFCSAGFSNAGWQMACPAAGSCEWIPWMRFCEWKWESGCGYGYASTASLLLAHVTVFADFSPIFLLGAVVGVAAVSWTSGRIADWFRLHFFREPAPRFANIGSLVCLWLCSTFMAKFLSAKSRKWLIALWLHWKGI